MLPVTLEVCEQAYAILPYALSGDCPLPGAVSSVPLGATYQILSSTVPPAYAHSTSVPLERKTVPSVPIGNLTFCVAFLVKISPCAVRTKFESPSAIRSQYCPVVSKSGLLSTVLEVCNTLALYALEPKLIASPGAYSVASVHVSPQRKPSVTNSQYVSGLFAVGLFPVVSTFAV